MQRCARRHLPERGAEDGHRTYFRRRGHQHRRCGVSQLPFDAGLGAGGIAFWEFTAPVALDSGAVGLIFNVAPESPSFNGPAWALSTSIDSMVAQIRVEHELHDAAQPERSVQGARPRR